MNQKFSYLLNVVLAIGLFLCVFRFGCKKETPVKEIIEIADSNTYYDVLDDEYQAKTIILYDSIEKLNKGLKSSKIVYRNKIVQVWSDSMVTTDECGEVVNQANYIISSQDSLLGIQVRSLDACESQVLNLRKQVTHNQNLKNEYQNLYKECFRDSNKQEKKAKRNRILGIVLSSILVSLVIIK
jgi:hypothetical protein